MPFFPAKVVVGVGRFRFRFGAAALLPRPSGSPPAFLSWLRGPGQGRVRGTCRSGAGADASQRGREHAYLGFFLGRGEGSFRAKNSVPSHAALGFFPRRLAARGCSPFGSCGRCRGAGGLVAGDPRREAEQAFAASGSRVRLQLQHPAPGGGAPFGQPPRGVPAGANTEGGQRCSLRDSRGFFAVPAADPRCCRRFAEALGGGAVSNRLCFGRGFSARPRVCRGEHAAALLSGYLGLACSRGLPLGGSHDRSGGAVARSSCSWRGGFRDLRTLRGPAVAAARALEQMAGGPPKQVVYAPELLIHAAVLFPGSKLVAAEQSLPSCGGDGYWFGAPPHAPGAVTFSWPHQELLRRVGRGRYLTVRVAPVLPSVRFGKGFYPWENDRSVLPSGQPFRWMGPVGELWVPRHCACRQLRLALVIPALSLQRRPEVSLWVGGVAIARTVPESERVQLAVELPVWVIERESGRVELRISETFRPAASGSGDSRVLGLQVRGVELVCEPSEQGSAEAR